MHGPHEISRLLLERAEQPEADEGKQGNIATHLAISSIRLLLLLLD